MSRGDVGYEDYLFKDGLLFYKGRIVIPSDSSLRLKLIFEFHATPTGGHAGVARTFHRLASNFFWRHMRHDVQIFVAACQICQQMKDSHLHPTGLLQPLPIPDQVFEDIAMDFITCLPSSKGKTTIMIVVDRLTKYGHFIQLPSTFSTHTVAEAFVVGIIRLHGPPRTIVTDRDPRFLHLFWQEIHRLQGSTLAMSTAYHPQTDGQSGALNKCVEQYLRCFVAEVPSHWVAMIPWAEYWYNTSYQTTSGMTPFQALYGREPPTIARYILGSTASELVESYLLQRDEVLQILRHNLLKAHNHIKLLADKSRTDTTFDIGDWVYVKLKPFRQTSLCLQRDHKIGRHYFGPYQVLKRVGNVAYRLALPESAKIHSVFHASMLKRCLGTPNHQVTPLLLGDTTDTVDPVDPNLEDKVAFEEGSIVVNENRDDVEATQAEHMGMPRKTSRTIIPPKRLGDYVWKGKNARDKG